MGYSDAYCKFTMVDVGAAGRQSDGGIFNASEIGKRLKAGSLNVPPPEPLVPNGVSLPYIFVGDEAFALSNFMLRPYSRRYKLDLKQRVFNYRLSRPRRIVEAAFGILTGVWQVLKTTMKTSVTGTIQVTKACICLHNFILMFDENRQQDVDAACAKINRNSGAGVYPATHQFSSSGEELPNATRDHFADFFMTTGAVPFQWDKAVNSNF